jgi:Ectoine synthase
MYYRNIEDLIGSEREAEGEGWKSRRFLLAEDGLPFSVHETSVAASSVLRFNYRNHSETVYCLEGRVATDGTAIRLLKSRSPCGPACSNVARRQENARRGTPGFVPRRAWRGRYSTLISKGSRFSIFSFGTCTFSTPSLLSARIAFASAYSGRVKLRQKVP